MEALRGAPYFPSSYKGGPVRSKFPAETRTERGREIKGGGGHVNICLNVVMRDGAERSVRVSRGVDSTRRQVAHKNE